MVNLIRKNYPRSEQGSEIRPFLSSKFYLLEDFRSELWRRLRGNLITAHKHLKCRKPVDGGGLFGGEQQQNKGQRAETGTRMFHTNTRNNFFTVRVMEHWNKLPRKAAESPSLVIFKTCLDAFLCNMLYRTSGVGHNDPYIDPSMIPSPYNSVVLCDVYSISSFSVKFNTKDLWHLRFDKNWQKKQLTIVSMNQH